MESRHGSASGSVATITLTDDASHITVICRSATLTDTIYFTIDGSTPAVAGDDTYVAVPNVPGIAPASGISGNTVKLISNATPGYSVVAS
jgi:hypothetical protein